MFSKLKEALLNRIKNFVINLLIEKKHLLVEYISDIASKLLDRLFAAIKKK